MFEDLNKIKQEIKSFKEDIQKLRENENSSTKVISDNEPEDKPESDSLNQQKANPFGDDYDSTKSTAKKATFGCVGCLGIVGVIIAIMILLLSSMCLKSCAKTDNVSQIKGQSLTDEIGRAAIATIAGDDAGYSDLQTKKDVERILDSEGFCVTEHEGVLSNEGWQNCLYFGFASEVRVSYDRNSRVRNVSYQNLIPGSQLLSLAINWLFQ